jgi:hypothetical protein
MAGLIVAHKEILRSNPYGDIYVGARRGDRFQALTNTGEYPSRQGQELIPLPFVEDRDSRLIHAIVPTGRTVFLTMFDHLNNDRATVYKLMGMSSSMQVNDVQLESGVDRDYLSGRVQLLSWDAVQQESYTRIRTLFKTLIP